MFNDSYIPNNGRFVEEINVSAFDDRSGVIKGFLFNLSLNGKNPNVFDTALQDLSENAIGADGGILLAEMLTRNQILRKLTLRCK